MTDNDKEVLGLLKKTILAFEFPKVNTEEAGKVLHDVSALLIKVANHIQSKIDKNENTI